MISSRNHRRHTTLFSFSRCRRHVIKFNNNRQSMIVWESRNNQWFLRISKIDHIILTFQMFNETCNVHHHWSKTTLIWLDLRREIVRRLRRLIVVLVLDASIRFFDESILRHEYLFVSVIASRTWCNLWVYNHKLRSSCLYRKLCTRFNREEDTFFYCVNFSWAIVLKSTYR